MGTACFSTNHQWQCATYLPITEPGQIKEARDAGIVTVPQGVTCDALELVCMQCRGSYDDVADQPCIVAREGNSHLRGGPVGSRRRRKCPEHNVSYDRCADKHAVPANYGRPPMPAADVAALRSGT